ncbi:carbamoyl-phosphate synth [Calocera cornea HHB12733]|uniref:Pyrimidine-specific carbamoyl phosphate synthase-aspartate carbamoyl transferase n=1 Tax=Calocera cornea HHB12733 TaxID=1353952 RepID=A0A165IG08_9BASI|nr:carbamoyl-phosphate synth [Calocera cornea HHB12733]
MDPQAAHNPASRDTKHTPAANGASRQAPTFTISTSLAGPRGIPIPSSGLSVSSGSPEFDLDGTVADLTPPAGGPAQATNGTLSVRSPLVPLTPAPPVTVLPSALTATGFGNGDAVLELADGTAYEGISFGAPGKSVAGECVFQTGMVGYTESLTDPSYEGQILVLTYPLVGNYGVPERKATPLGELPPEFESSRIHIAGLVVAYYSEDFSHFLARSSLGAWLKENGVPAVYGIDTRALTKRIREKGSMLGKLLARKPGAPDRLSMPYGSQAVGPVTPGSRAPSRTGSPTSIGAWKEDYEDVPFNDPNALNLVQMVSISQPRLYTPKDVSRVEPLMHPSGRPLRVVAVDVGMKYNQIRCFTSRGIELKVVPWDYDFLAFSEEAYDGLFISNGPGDPTMVSVTIERLRKALSQTGSNMKPLFGICLGHQLLALATGAHTKKMKYGNRGHNIPCTDAQSGRCYITSQNHGFEVDTRSLPDGWTELFQNANDGSNEGIYHTEKPFFSVQFHPESTPGPRDTEFLFDVFIGKVVDYATQQPPSAVLMPGGSRTENEHLVPRATVRKVLILGSGGLSIGQAGEFDYSGSQALKALKEENIYTILLNPNIATIATSKGMADKVYYLPVTSEFVRKVINYERPDGIYVTFGGQTALNVGIQLKDEFAKLGVQVLGTPIDTIIMTEDRELFARSMEQIGERCAQSASATTTQDAVVAAGVIGYPVIVRAAFALGGLGSGFAKNEQELTALCNKAFATSPQVLVEKSMKGWKEIEYEVVRDCRDNCITVCNMENFDPLGIHTGDSIVVAPSQTLSDTEYNMLRTTAVNVIRHLGVVGECNIQYALNPFSKEYCIIEVNARLSRSSALASKATGYPLAFIAAKLGLGIPLNEIKNSVTKVTCACFEPSLDYVVVKFPRWDLKKFTRVSKLLNSSMKSVGEVMSIGRTFEETIQKAIRAMDDSCNGFEPIKWDGADSKEKLHAILDDELSNPTDKRMFAIATAFSEGYTVDRIWELTNIDKWFLRKLESVYGMSQLLSEYTASSISPGMLRQAKRMGFCDTQLASYLGSNELAVRRIRQEYGISPFVKQIDTVAAEFPAYTNYLYTTYNAVEHDVSFGDRGIIVLGSGVYRIGSSVEFDWCAVRAIRTLRDQGYKTVMINYNPETVSTDYDEADRLYFENISLETVLDIYDVEHSSGVILSMGGQTPNNIALPLYRQNVTILGTSPEMIDTAENRFKFSRLLDKIGVDQPLWKELTSLQEAHEFCAKVNYPVLVRPSYVLSGAAMNVVYSADDLSNFLGQAAEVSREYPVVISKYIEEAKEIEMDAIAKDGKLVMHYISEHIENAGVHSGDATLVLPPQDLDPETVRRIEDATQKIGNALNVTGPFNIQFIAKNNEIKVIECNLRAARSFPFVSKVTGIDAVEMATKVMLGISVQSYPDLDLPPDYVGVKAPQFSFSRLAGADPVLGVEMASTGEVACFGENKWEAYLKAFLATGNVKPKSNILISIGGYKEKLEMLPSMQKLHRAGYNLFATAGTADFFTEHHVPCKYLEALPANETDKQKLEYSLTHHLSNRLIDLYINLPSRNKYRRPEGYSSRGYVTRRMAVDFAIPIITNVKVAKLLIEAVIRKLPLNVSPVDFKTSHTTFTFPGLINVNAYVPDLLHQDLDSLLQATRASISAGFTTMHIISDGGIKDGPALELAQRQVSGKTYSDYALSVVATAENVQSDDIKIAAKSLCIPSTGNISVTAAHFTTWPADKPIVTDATTNELASILLLASLNNRSVHVTNVRTKEDILLIALSKGKDLKVTCDVAVYSLFFTRDKYLHAPCLPTIADQQALWENLACIDVFSTGPIPYRLAKALGHHHSPWSGFEETMPLLMSAVIDGRLTLEDIKVRLHDNPLRIFDVPEQTSTHVEVVVDRDAVFTARQNHWSPLEGRMLPGNVHRVVMHGQTAYLDGIVASSPLGRDVSGIISPKRHAVDRPRRASVVTAIKPQIQEVPPSPTMSNGSFKSPQLRASDGGSVPTMSALIGPATTASPASMASTAPRGPPRPFAGFTGHPAFSRRHILSVGQFSHQDVHDLFNIAHEMRLQVERNGSIDILRGRVLCTLFYEPSTRTSSSFEAAMKRLGGEVVQVPTDRSSVVKGETLPDTIRTLACYTDAIVIRHPAVGSAQQAAKYSPVPIINAGDGIGEHPTQALLDVYTIRSELGTVNGKVVTMMGDLKNGRTVHSLVKLLSYYQVKLNFVSPPSLGMPSSVKSEARKAGIPYAEYSSLDEVLSQTDVLYVTRVQQERFTNQADYDAVKDAYVVNHAVLTRAKPEMIVMHPLPRVSEIDPEVDFDSRRAVYFRQMRYGLFIRMALLASVMA